MCYNKTVERETTRKEGKTMKTWYTVELGAMVQEKTFDTYEGAEIFAMGLAVTTGKQWHVEKNFGWC